ncbi:MULTISPECIES: dTDP-4-dehydrorhamnose 3,5-epimerase [unclassified Bradyrhizobium]|uniref:dTDP-4-dehydrorhamnose 3,5-epimerase n=1 Tax=unclassified Bradyrhizobium TaxID=2631580 RepID=UPI0029165CF0|nr:MULTISPECIES: dTDP-4-dehydrorhamnose 3,5-epimerase [unclassified Bradyrhizobium]
MDFQHFEIDGLVLIVPSRRGDHRGFFSETFRKDDLRAHGVTDDLVQENHVFSAERGVLRGLHFQLPPKAQGKLVRCVGGSILDVAVDIRRGSPTYGRHVAIELSAANWKQLWVPSGFAHGYVTLEAPVEVIYKVTDYWAPDLERGIAWDDPDLAIDWRLAVEPILSEKDQRNPRLSSVVSPFSVFSSFENALGND